ncbi:MAG: hypothetical protein KAK00_04690 [Nanoarchaeota archaeon]|nr:hypothetical protein [Nanoarchaeota archaeon]
MYKFIQAFDYQKTIGINGRKRIVSPLTELTPQAEPALLRECTSYLAKYIKPSHKILTEEHGAGHIAGALSYLNGNDLAIARWTPDGLAKSLEQYFSKGAMYRGGNLILHGVQPGDTVDIIDDVMDKGETLETLISLVESHGAIISDIYVIVEKTYNGRSIGRENLKSRGHKINSLLEVEVSGEISHVTQANLPRTIRYLDNPQIEWSDNLLARSYENQELIELENHMRFMLVPLSEHYPLTSAPLLRETVDKLSSLMPENVDKIVAEFDRCAHILGAISLHTKLPIGGAKWFPGPINLGSDFKMEYYEGRLFPYGINSGDKCYLIDDTVSSGGTMVGFINLITKMGAKIVGAAAAVEKEEYKGIQRIKKETGIEVDRILGISIAGQKTKVISDRFRE